MQAEQFFFSLPCSQPTHCAHLLFTMPCEQRLSPIPHHSALPRAKTPSRQPSQPLHVIAECAARRIVSRVRIADAFTETGTGTPRLPDEYERAEGKKARVSEVEDASPGSA